MPQRMGFYLPLQRVFATVGTWALTAASNSVTLNKTAGDNTSVLYVALKADPETPNVRENTIKSVDFSYDVATVALDAAPTFVVSKETTDETTGVRVRTVIPATVAFKGTNTVGLAVGTYLATVSITTPARTEPNEELWVQVTIDAAATSVVRLINVRQNYA